MNPVSPISVTPVIPDSSVVRAGSTTKSSGFMDTLQGAMKEVEGLQASAQQKVSSLLEGGGQDIHGAMLAVEQADLSFQLMLQVRNKMVNAYQEISRMQF